MVSFHLFFYPTDSSVIVDEAVTLRYYIDIFFSVFVAAEQ